jgi:hypothetical protein
MCLRTGPLSRCRTPQGSAGLWSISDASRAPASRPPPSSAGSSWYQACPRTVGRLAVWDYTIPAVALAGVVVVGALIAAMLLVLRPICGLIVLAVIDVAMMLFELVEMSLVGPDVWRLSPTLGKRIPGFDPASVPCPAGYFRCRCGCSRSTWFTGR